MKEQRTQLRLKRMQRATWVDLINHGATCLPSLSHMAQYPRLSLRQVGTEMGLSIFRCKRVKYSQGLRNVIVNISSRTLINLVTGSSAGSASGSVPAYLLCSAGAGSHMETNFYAFGQMFVPRQNNWIQRGLQYATSITMGSTQSTKEIRAYSHSQSNSR